ncbi:MAG: LapA family protein [Bacteroidota bacterium]
MRSSAILALFIATVAVVFALQNAVPVTVSFLTWRFEGSLALILLVTLTLGVFLGLIVSIPALVRKTRMFSSQRAKIAELEEPAGSSGIAWTDPSREAFVVLVSLDPGS